MIELRDYWMGRDEKYPLAMTPAIEASAWTMVGLANKFLTLAKGAGVPMATDPTTGTIVRSGWRPPAVNSTTAGASKTSRHMTGEAIDLHDPAGKIAAWAFANQNVLKDLGLWLEHPEATKGQTAGGGWCHLQSKPPGSGSRVFRP